MLLESKPSLQFDHTTRKTAQGAPEVWVGDDRAAFEKANRREIKHIESVEEIGAQLEVRIFINEWRRDLLSEAQINIEMARAAKRISIDSWWSVGRQREI